MNKENTCPQKGKCEQCKSCNLCEKMEEMELKKALDEMKYETPKHEE